VDNFNVHPLHLSFQNASSGSTHSTLYSPYQLNSIGFQSFSNAGSTSNHSSLKFSGFQYLLSSALVSSVADSFRPVESVSIVIKQTITEGLKTFEIADTRPVRVGEAAPPSDSAVIINKQTVTEGLILRDSATGKGFSSGQDTSLLAERVSVKNKQTIPEPLLSRESVTIVVRLTATYGVKFNGIIRNTLPFTSKFRVKQRLTNQFSSQFQGKVNSLIGITATGGTYVMTASGGSPVFLPNPINPTLSIGGINYIGTAPPAAANTNVYVNLPNTGIPGLDWSQIWNFGMSTNYSGGTFRLETLPYLGGKGTQLNIFGLPGTITNPGRKISNSMKGYTTEGIFGVPLLNKQFKLLANSSSLITSLTGGLVGSQSLTARTISQAIATLCGINLTWLAQDIPVTVFSYEPTMNGLSALNSMAQRVGANLRWMGGINYYVAYPNTTLGNFIIPNQKLITANGLSYSQPQDLETGVGGVVGNNAFGSPVQSISVYNNLPVNFSAGLGQIPLNPNNPQASSGSVVQTPLYPITTIGKQLTSSSPASIYTLPYNYQDVLIQILVPDTYSTNGIRYMTSDPNVWDIFVAPSFNGSGSGIGSNPEYIYKVLEGGAYVNKVKIEYRIFPSHPAIDAGDFEFKVSCTLKQPQAQTINKNYTRPLQWIKTYQGTIECLFYGVLPVPGMFGSATAEDLTVQGVIENVNFSSAGTIQLNVAQYTGINWLIPYSQLDNSGI